MQKCLVTCFLSSTVVSTCSISFSCLTTGFEGNKSHFAELDSVSTRLSPEGSADSSPSTSDPGSRRAAAAWSEDDSAPEADRGPAGEEQEDQPDHAKTRTEESVEQKEPDIISGR